MHNRKCFTYSACKMEATDFRFPLKMGRMTRKYPLVNLDWVIWGELSTSSEKNSQCCSIIATLSWIWSVLVCSGWIFIKNSRMASTTVWKVIPITVSKNFPLRNSPQVCRIKQMLELQGHLKLWENPHMRTSLFTSNKKTDIHNTNSLLWQPFHAEAR